MLPCQNFPSILLYQFISTDFQAFKISYSTAATKTHYKRPIRSNCEPLSIHTIWLILTNIPSWWNAKRASVICKVRLKLKTIFSKCAGCHKFARMTHRHRPTMIQNRTVHNASLTHTYNIHEHLYNIHTFTYTHIYYSQFMFRIKYTHKWCHSHSSLCGIFDTREREKRPYTYLTPPTFKIMRFSPSIVFDRWYEPA